MSFTESLVDESTPWAACLELARFLEGNECQLNDGTNWLGAASLSERKADGSQESVPQLAEALAWGYVAIRIRESLARSFNPEEQFEVASS